MSIREGLKKKKLFSWIFTWGGPPPPAPLPWKIINFLEKKYGGEKNLKTLYNGMKHEKKQ